MPIKILNSQNTVEFLLDIQRIIHNTFCSVGVMSSVTQSPHLYTLINNLHT